MAVEKIAVVGPRKGGDKDAVESFTSSLFQRCPDAILVSGGADGVDNWAETSWLRYGGLVWSYRIQGEGNPPQFNIVKWELGGPSPRKFPLLGEPIWADAKSALYYRSMIVAEVADRVCAFEGIDRMRGTEFTVWVAKEGEQKATYVWNGETWDTFNT